MPTEFIENITQPDEVVKIPNHFKKVTSENSVQDNIDDYISKFIDITNNAKDNENKEKTMSLMEGLKTFPKAAIWSVVLSTALIMEGYDTNLIGSFYAFPSFQQKFGKLYPGEGYQVPAKWQTVLTMTTFVGEIVGLFAAGIVADRFGFRKTLIGCLFLVIAFIFIVFFAENLNTLIVGEVLLGIPWGAFQTLTISYASEVCPLVLRVYLTTYITICWVLGQLISSCILKGLVNSTIKDAYRIPFAIQWFWPIPIMIGIFFAPESPWWLVKKGKTKEAKNALRRLLTENKNLPDKDVLAEGMLRKIQMTIEEEDVINSSASYWDCFKGNDLRRTRVSSIVFMIQNIAGAALMGYSTYFYEQAGLSKSNSFTFSIVQCILGLIGTVVCWFLAQKMGRFPMYFTGLCIQCMILIVIGGLGFADSTGASWAIGSLLLILVFVFDCASGPLTFCIVAEIPSTKLRTKTIIIARNVYNISGIVISIVTPYMLNPTAWNWKAKTGLLWAGFALGSVIWSYFELPETKGRTFAELDALFNKRVPARKFKTTEISVFDAGELLEKIGEDGVKEFVANNEDSTSLNEKA